MTSASYIGVIFGKLNYNYCVSGYNEAPVLELCSTYFIVIIGMVLLIRVPSMGQIDSLENYLY